MLWIAILFLNLALAHEPTQDLGHTATAEALRAGAMAKQKEIDDLEKKEPKTEGERKEKEDKLKKLKAEQMQLLSEMQKHLAAQGQLKQSDGQKGQQMAGGGSGGGEGEGKKPPMMPPPSGGEKKDDDKKKDEKKDTAEKPAEKPPIDLNAKSSEKDSSEKQTVSKEELKDLKALLDSKEKDKEKEGGVSYSKKVDETIKEIEASSNAAVQQRFKQALAVAESNDEKFQEKEKLKAKEVAEETVRQDADLKIPGAKLSRSLFADSLQGAKKKSAKETLGKPRRARGMKKH